MHNLVEPILAQVERRPDKVAIRSPRDADTKNPRYDELRYADIGDAIARYQAGFQAEGLVAGDRVIVLFRPGSDLYCLLPALLASGLVPVFIDPGMGLGKIRHAVIDSRAKAVISTIKLLRWRWLLPVLRGRRCYAVDGRGRGIRPLSILNRNANAPPVVFPCDSATHGLISFTSGSIGRPKGADRTHHSLIQQHLVSNQQVPLAADDICLSGLPLTLLHGLCCGVTNLLPVGNLATPAAIDPRPVARQLEAEGVTVLVGAPVFIGHLADFLAENDIGLPHLRLVAVGGAPSSPSLCRRYRRGFPAAEVIIVYGSTEAEPISWVGVDEILASSGTGVLVGVPRPPVRMALAVLPRDRAIEEEALEQYRVGAGEIGEVLVKGPHVLKRYVDNPAATRENKIPCADGEVWHRTGDTGYRDQAGRLWLTGRCKDLVTHRGQSLQPFPLEMAIDELAGVRRSAIIQGSDSDQGLLILEAEPAACRQAVGDAVNACLAERGLADLPHGFVVAIPMDGRHNSKIDRPSLRARFSQPTVTPASDHPWIIRLNWADRLTLVGAVLASGSAALVLAGHYSFALALLFGAMLCDGMDGPVARKFHLSRPFGRYLDGFVDALDYLFIPALFLYQWGFNGPVHSLILVLFLITGIVRLAVFNQVGNLTSGKSAPGYWGMPVFWSVFILAGAYMAALVVAKSVVFGLLSLVLVLYAVAMVRNRYFFKFNRLSQIIGLTLAGMILFTVLGAQQAYPGLIVAFLPHLWTALLFIAVPIVGGVAHMVVVTKNWFPRWAIPIHQSWFGANKTWRALLLMPVLAIPGAWLALRTLDALSLPLTVDGWAMNPILLGISTALAYLLFELPNSFTKRRLGIPPGGRAKHHPYWFAAMDQLDSSLGIALAALVLYRAPWPTVGLLFVLFPLIAMSVKRLLYRLKLKDSYL